MTTLKTETHLEGKHPNEEITHGKIVDWFMVIKITILVYSSFLLDLSISGPRDPGSPSQNGFMEPKYFAFRFGDEGHPLLIWLSLRWARIPRDEMTQFEFIFGGEWKYVTPPKFPVIIPLMFPNKP